MDKKRLYISADIEGVAGVATMEHLTPKGFEYNQAREWMTAEVVAAADAAFDSGIDEIVVRKKVDRHFEKRIQRSNG